MHAKKVLNTCAETTEGTGTEIRLIDPQPSCTVNTYTADIELLLF
jgi:hypothetical protein